MSKTLMCIIAAILFIPVILLGVVFVCIGANTIGWAMIILGILFLLIVIPIAFNYLNNENNDTNTRN